MAEDKTESEAMNVNEYDVDIQFYQREYHPGPGIETQKVWDCDVTIVHIPSYDTSKPIFPVSSIDDRLDETIFKSIIIGGVRRYLTKDAKERAVAESNHYHYTLDARALLEDADE